MATLTFDDAVRAAPIVPPFETPNELGAGSDPFGPLLSLEGQGLFDALTAQVGGDAPLLLAQADAPRTATGATGRDPINDLVRSGDLGAARAFMRDNPERIEEVIDAFAGARPGLVPDLIEASADVIAELAPEQVEGETSVWTRVFGGLRAIGGGLEAAAGGAVVAAPDPFIVTDILGAAAVVHGADNAQAGLRQLWTGREVESGTELAAEGLARVLGAEDGTAELIGDGVDLALGLGLGSASGIRALGDLARKTGTVWDDIVRSAGVGNWGDTVVPRAFEMATGGTRFSTRIWVHPNASEHIAERASSMAVRLIERGLPTELADLGAQVQLRSLQRAVGEAAQGGLPIDELVEIGGWQLKFGAPREAGQLPALIHAIPLSYLN